MDCFQLTLSGWVIVLIPIDIFFDRSACSLFSLIDHDPYGCSPELFLSAGRGSIPIVFDEVSHLPGSIRRDYT